MFKLLEGKTDQETFDKVVIGLQQQGKPAFDSTMRACLYRAGDCKCAIGLLFPEDAPREALHFRGTVFELVNRGYIKIPRNLTLLKELQKAHDDSIPRDDHSDKRWRHECIDRLIEIADTRAFDKTSILAWQNQERQ